MHRLITLLLILCLSTGCWTQLSIVVTSSSSPNTDLYVACAEAAYAQVGLQLVLPDQLAWTIQLSPASSFNNPAIIASTEISNEYSKPYSANTNVNVDHDYYFGLDGQCPSDEYDLMSVFMHELIHALGMNGYISSSGTFTMQTSSFDLFITDSTCQPVRIIPSTYTAPYYFKCKYQLEGFTYHYTGDPLMSAVRYHGDVYHCLSEAVLDTMASIGWNTTMVVCSSGVVGLPFTWLMIAVLLYSIL